MNMEKPAWNGVDRRRDSLVNEAEDATTVLAEQVSATRHRLVLENSDVVDILGVIPHGADDVTILLPEGQQRSFKMGTKVPVMWKDMRKPPTQSSQEEVRRI